MGFCIFYRRFIKGFSKMVKPMVKLTCKGAIFQLSSDCQHAFDQLETATTKASVLRQFDRTKDAVLEIDSSDSVTGGVLSQYDDDGLLYPMAFYSKNLSPAECNYHIYDKELLVIMKCLEYWRPELECTDISVKIFTDYKDLIYFTKGRNLSRRQERYLNMLSEFNIGVGTIILIDRSAMLMFSNPDSAYIAVQKAIQSNNPSRVLLASGSPASP